MWLIDCKTLVLVNVRDPKLEKYAILSHTWEAGQEISFQEFNSSNRPKEKRGWRKITKTCRLALEDGCEYAWVDTCNIDQTSSAELSEAINSMFKWYGRSYICYAYLSDYDIDDPDANMSKSRYFQRGWTLQELIAPDWVRFYDKNWKKVGSKRELREDLAKITGIDEQILKSPFNTVRRMLSDIPIARKMSWAAKRKTTRDEDKAYCLLGIFRVNMPLLYGEGKSAFIRLQEEIAKTTGDLSLLAWRCGKYTDRATLDEYTGVFAHYPGDFEHSAHLELVTNSRFLPEFSINNKGLRIGMPLSYSRKDQLYTLRLNCRRPKEGEEERMLSIYLKYQGANKFARARPCDFASTGYDTARTGTVFLSTILSPAAARYLRRSHQTSFNIDLNLESKGWKRTTAIPESFWEEEAQRFLNGGATNFVGFVSYHREPEWVFDESHKYPAENRPAICLAFGYGYGFEPWVRLYSFAVDHSNYPHPRFWLADEMQRENWQQVAIKANTEPLRRLDLKMYNKLSQSSERVKDLVKLHRRGSGSDETYYIVKDSS